MRARTLFGVLLGVAATGGLVFATGASADHIPPGDGNGEQFVWPVSSWVAANDEYVCCSHHSGSADLANDLFTPVYPARAGEVGYSQYLDGAWRVRIQHETVGGQTYVTDYGHLVEKPLVEVGQRVDVNEPLGYLGRTGNANLSGPHVHFTIYRGPDEDNLAPMEIPELEIGTWVESGDFVPGDYEGLDAIEPRPRTFDVQVSEPDGLNVYETTDRPADQIVGELSAGDEVTVLQSRNGQYRIEFDGELGWVPHSGTLPVRSTVFGVRVTADSSANIRRGPSESTDVIGQIAGNDHRYLTGYATRAGWSRVLWPCDAETNRSADTDDDSRPLGGCPGRDDGEPPYFKYGWIGPAVHERSSTFTTRTRVEGLNVYRNEVVGGENQPDCPCDAGSEIGEVGQIRSLVTVEDTHDGWYRIDHDGQLGWIRGWYTAGRQ